MNQSWLTGLPEDCVICLICLNALLHLMVNSQLENGELIIVMAE